MLKQYLNQHNIPRNPAKIFFFFHERFWFIKDEGANFTGKYVSLVTQIGMWGMIIKILFNVELNVVGKWLIILIVINIASDFIVGVISIISGLYNYRLNLRSKNKTMNPVSYETIETLKSICGKLGIEHSFSEVDKHGK